MITEKRKSAESGNKNTIDTKNVSRETMEIIYDRKTQKPRYYCNFNKSDDG